MVVLFLMELWYKAFHSTLKKGRKINETSAKEHGGNYIVIDFKKINVKLNMLK